eukprot:TRINITY_DN11029_c0_g1_i2.p1 TRINITY_DN11029_c0_g1~~TRINITY_DN11029_c0_g1_i2.p1  ORF type:complete len:669 (+),score=143.37 TRINITY_DN11029_c0_g1_i2:84-2090(+)
MVDAAQHDDISVGTDWCRQKDAELCPRRASSSTAASSQSADSTTAAHGDDSEFAQAQRPSLLQRRGLSHERYDMGSPSAERSGERHDRCVEQSEAESERLRVAPSDEEKETSRERENDVVKSQQDEKSCALPCASPAGESVRQATPSRPSSLAQRRGLSLRGDSNHQQAKVIAPPDANVTNNSSVRVPPSPAKSAFTWQDSYPAGPLSRAGSTDCLGDAHGSAGSRKGSKQLVDELLRLPVNRSSGSLHVPPSPAKSAFSWTTCDLESPSRKALLPSPKAQLQRQRMGSKDGASCPLAHAAVPPSPAVSNFSWDTASFDGSPSHANLPERAGEERMHRMCSKQSLSDLQQVPEEEDSPKENGNSSELNVPSRRLPKQLLSYSTIASLGDCAITPMSRASASAEEETDEPVGARSPLSGGLREAPLAPAALEPSAPAAAPALLRERRGLQGSLRALEVESEAERCYAEVVPSPQHPRAEGEASRRADAQDWAAQRSPRPAALQSFAGKRRNPSKKVCPAADGEEQEPLQQPQAQAQQSQQQSQQQQRLSLFERAAGRADSWTNRARRRSEANADGERQGAWVSSSLSPPRSQRREDGATAQRAFADAWRSAAAAERAGGYSEPQGDGAMRRKEPRWSNFMGGQAAAVAGVAANIVRRHFISGRATRTID